MILDHIANRSILFIKTSPASDSDILTHSDLNRVDIAAIPDRLENGIGKSLNKKVLHRLFSEIVIDPKNLFLVKFTGNDSIQFPCRIEIASKRLFDNHF